MLYEISLHTKEQIPEWECGIGSIPARLPNGRVVDLPILEGISVLTVGMAGSAKSKW